MAPILADSRTLEGLEPLRSHPQETLAAQTVYALPPLATDLDQAGFAQHSQVAGGGRPTAAETPGDFSSGHLAAPVVQNQQDLSTRRVGQGGEDLVDVGAGITRRLGENWLLGLHYEYAENDSSDPEFSYERNVVTLGVLRTF